MDKRLDGRGPAEIGGLAAAFNSMTDSLIQSLRRLAQRESLAALGEFAASLAHEIRNPLECGDMNGAPVLGDATALHHVFLNVLLNSAQAVGADGVVTHNERAQRQSLHRERSGRRHNRPTDTAHRLRRVLAQNSRPRAPDDGLTPS